MLVGFQILDQWRDKDLNLFIELMKTVFSVYKEDNFERKNLNFKIVIPVYGQNLTCEHLIQNN